MRRKVSRGALIAGLIAGSTAAHAAAFSTSVASPTPVPANGVIEGNFPAGSTDATYYFAVDLKAGKLASQMSVQGGAQYKSLDLGLLDRGGHRIDAYYITAGATDNSEGTRVFPIDASGKYVVRLTTKGPETTSFRVALGGSALPSREAPGTQAGASRSYLAPSPVPADGVVAGAFPGGDGYAYYYFAADLKAGNLLTQMSVSGRDGALKWMSLTLLDDNGRPDKSYFMSRVDANADATRSFPIDRSGHYVMRLALQGAETNTYKLELGGDALAGRK